MAVILAGGRGNRLGVLTAKRAKPAVPFGGKYRIIDFTLSNCVNSLVYNVCVLTQYRPHSLMHHLGRGAPWDLNRFDGGLTLLHPHPGGLVDGWYRGTADAVTQNLPWLRDQKPERALILSGDHVYKMDYARMIEEHKRSGARVTVAAMEVPWEDASRFGVIEADDDGTITRFLEKVPDPPSNLANMGIYVFDLPLLDELLVEDASNEASAHDFGKNILPTCVERKVGIRVHRFQEAYWRDVGTIQSYWRTNMDLISPVPEFDLYDPKTRVHTRSAEAPAVKLGRGAKVSESLVSNGCVVDGVVQRSVLSPHVVVKAGAVVRDSIIFSDSVVGEGAVVDRCILDKNVTVGVETLLGTGEDMTPNAEFPELYTSGLTVVGRNARIPRQASIGRNVCVFPDVTDAKAFHDREVESGATIQG
ncbi:MAG: glucose-1-phosphate adenylyltransferase [Candidatus Coatesbacteria bacterium]|nr:glucose-1-phosphate adenylyltransferase [Candidatus Coatesbacteria bacterium]